jgi:2-iminoacetate synthase ThiH
MKTSSKQAKPIKPEDISPEDFSKHLTMLRWLAREYPGAIRFIVPTIETYYKHHGGPRLREGNAS